jgi:hypothetical protein
MGMEMSSRVRLTRGLTDRLFDRFAQIIYSSTPQGYLVVDRDQFWIETDEDSLLIHSGLGGESEFEWNGSEEDVLRAVQLAALHEVEEVDWELRQGGVSRRGRGSPEP